MKRRLISLICVMALCLTLLPITALAAGDAEIEGWSDPSQNKDEDQQVGWSARGNFDIDWYTEGPNTADEYVLYDAADLAGLAVIVNGAYKVKGNEEWYNVSADLSGGDTTPKPNGSAFKIGEGVQDDFAGKTIVLAASTTFDLSEHVWVPIGYGETFKGTFEGNSENGTKITGMTIQSSSGSVGLFGQITGATIQNVTVENARITAELQTLGSIDGEGAGGIVGYITQDSSASGGLVTNCTFSGSIQGTENNGYTSVGGIVGHLEGSNTYAVTVENCVSAAEITGKGYYIGGVAGWNDGYATITGCRNDGSITLETGSRVGGIVGYARGDVTNCVNNGAVTRTGQVANGGYAIGGIAGVVQACKLEGCVNNGTISVAVQVNGTGGSSTGGTGDGGIDVGVDDEGGDNPTHIIYVGGVAGLLMLYSESTDAGEASFIDCHNRAKVTGNATTNAGTAYLGGILGSMLRSSSRNVVIQRCSNTGDLTAQAHRASILGGLVGSQSVTGAYKMTLSQCYNAGTVTIASSSEGNNSRAGGLMGYAGGNTVFEDCYNVGDVKYTDSTVEDTQHSFYLGGLAGQVEAAAVGGSGSTGGQYGSATFTRCYNAGTVNANGQTGAGIGGITGGVTSNATISATNTSYLTDCVVSAGTTPVSGYGDAKSANEMTEDYTWATDAYLGLGETNWEKQANDLTDEDNLIGYLPVLKDNRQDPAPQLRRTVAENVTVTITNPPSDPILMGSEPITLNAEVTGGTYSTLYWTTGSDAVATVSGSGSQNTTGTVTITGPGETVITAVAYDSNNKIVGSGFVTLTVTGSPVSAVTISDLTAPVQGKQPVAAASVAATAYYTLEGVTWEGDLDSSGMFKLGETYTAVFTLSPKTGCSFESTVAVTLTDRKGDDDLTYSATATKDGDNLTVRVTFESLPHTHKWASYWSHDDTADPGYHWHNCLNDGCPITDNSQKSGYASHSDETMLWRDDGNGNHYLKCYVCGATYNTAAHASTTWQVDTQTNQHYQVCDTCGRVFNLGYHVADTTQWLRGTDQYGNGYHYHACTSCGAELDVEAHELKTDGTLVGGDYRYWQKSVSEHWRECKTCGEFDRALHESGYVEYNALTHRAGCPVCGYVTGTDFLPHVDGNGDRICDDCGASIGYTISFYDSDNSYLGAWYTDTNGKLAEDQWPSPGTAPEGKVFIGWYNNNTGTGGTRYTPDSKFTYSWKLYPRWGDYHTVTVEGTENGTVTASKTMQLVVNDTVTLTVTPAEGYRLKEGTLTVTVVGGGEIKPSKQSDGTYTFTMPDGNVMVSAEFEKLPSLYFIDPPQWIFTGLSQSVEVFYEGTTYVNLRTNNDQEVVRVYWIDAVGYTRFGIEPKNPGTVSITATSSDDPNVTDSFTLTVYAPINSAAITGLTAPAYGATPVTAAALTVSDNSYSVKTLVWQDENGETLTGSFTENTVYTAVITLQAEGEYVRFQDTAWATVDGKVATHYEVSEDGMTMTVRMTFSQTGHAHVWGEWINIGTQHYRQCTVSGCSEVEYEAHTVSEPDVWSYDALHHYNLCDVCDGAVNTAYHTGEGGEACSVCGGIIGYAVTLNPNGGTCATTKMYTNTYGYLEASDLPVPTNGSLPFQGWYTQETGGSQVTGQYRFQSDAVLYARWGEAQQYSITVTATPTEGGTVTASAEQAEANTTVNLTVTPADGYRLKALTVLDGSGNPVSVQNYSFTMPASDVEVTAEFEPIDSTALTIVGLPQQIIYVGNTFRLTTSGGSGGGTVTWSSSAEGVATVDSSGNIKAVGTGTVTITARRGGEQDQVTFTVSGEAIGAVTILNLKAPVQGETPAQTVMVPVDAHYGALTQMGMGDGTLDVTWKNQTGDSVSAFEADQAYTAVITLKAKDGYAFADQVSVTLESLQESAYSQVSAERDGAGNLVVTVTFNATDHAHSWDTEWSSDPLHHWHACLAEGCPALTSGMKDYGYHTDADGDGICDNCGAEIGCVITFNAGSGKVEPTETRTDTYGQLTIDLPTPTAGSGTFLGWFLADGTQVTRNTVFSENTTVYARWHVPSGGGVTTYPVTVAETEHGTVTVSSKNASRNTIVTVTVSPDEGYELIRLTVTDKDGGAVALTDIGGGKFTFQMPGSKVMVEAIFAAISPDYAACDGGADCPMWAFTDLDVNAWYHDGIHFCLDNGMMAGYGNGIFGPNNQLSRAMLVQILYNCENHPTVTGGSVFDDVADGAWYCDAVTWAAENGIVGGYGNGKYGPDDPITREQLAAILWRYAKYKGYDVSVGEDTNILSYTDAFEISEYAVPAFQWACGAGVIEGVTKSTLVPQGNATRAQAATMLMRFVTIIA